MTLYRRMTHADLPAAAAIEATVLDGWSASTLALTLACATNHCFVAVVQATDCVCGFCACSLVADVCNLDAISVADTHRRQGVGRGLLLHVMHMLRHASATCLQLEVRSLNVPARALYTSFGFSENGLRRAFYQHPADDAVLMQLSLPTVQSMEQ